MASGRPGKVYLIGAGPGDPRLITVRGRDLIARADVILYDNLAPTSLLDLAPPESDKIYVGKKRAQHHLSQDEINRLLIDKARAGLLVARLKGGDPYIFGRGGEEGQALADAGIPFEIVPGVSSATGVAAYAGFPLTHRDWTPAVTFVTGHEADRVDWNRLGHTETLVIFMGLTTFESIAERLIAAGRSPETPAAAVRWGTRPDQQTVTGTIADLAARIAAAHLKPPALLVVGEVVSLRDRLDWFERLPLFGKRIVVTRPREQGQAVADRLRELGAEPILLPAIEIQPPEDFSPLDQAIERLETYDWLLFTSQNGVARFTERLDRSSRDLRAVAGKIAAIGPATAAALGALHLKVDLMPDEYVAESVLAAMGSEVAGKRILLARAAVARDILPRELERRGAQVDVVPAYRSVAPPCLAEDAQRLLPEADWITFTSSSTVTNLVEAAGVDLLREPKLASIGPITSKTLLDHGLEAAVEAEPYTMEGLLAAIVKTA